MALSSVQEAAFVSAAGGSTGSGSVMTAIASIVLTLAMVWLGWSALRTFDQWRGGTLEFGEFAWNLIRGAMVVSVLIYYVR